MIITGGVGGWQVGVAPWRPPGPQLPPAGGGGGGVPFVGAAKLGVTSAATNAVTSKPRAIKRFKFIWAS